ncbi:SDR family NAD(P)-dependent oxidoreductase [Microbacterium sp. SORGH_AS_0888]|uniref:SDR family NAD(P)-dependent oxidoreductase n=1 Tax=Microbacterium sp. SORGH_AS_0888 TaxID=3041791 RepID=UPI002789E82E|nr:SDR family NAD(P)-dependent oxidoreductase [Microbacterium sp. SORGH_AS_0888]MDQ1130315.1 NAD(P)-dependent dehydrogenase (short-subunit alcohol dehydrogenase family) [Microbacterium sp. SORGH_AS_0888]
MTTSSAHRVPERAAPTFPAHRGRRILVTGGANGIGAATVERLVAEGALVAVVDVDGPGVDRLRARLGQSVVGVVADLADVGGIPGIVAQAAARLGGLDGVVGNAGIVRIRPAREHTVEDWHTQLDLNLVGSFEAARASVPFLLAGERERSIVFVSSESGKRGHIDMVAYNASKAAMISMTRVLAEEWAPLDINVNGVCPGGVPTAMLRDVAEHYAEGDAAAAASMFDAMVPARLGRHVTPDEVARVISFLLSPAAQAIRGQSINVDGGDAPY